MISGGTKKEHLLKRVIHKWKVGYICDALRDLVPFIQFEKHPLRSATFGKVILKHSLRLQEHEIVMKYTPTLYYVTSQASLVFPA